MDSRLDDGSDEHWMARYVEGHPSALPILYARYAPRFDALFARSFIDRSMRMDLLQQTFLKVHDARERFDPNAKVRPWLYSIALRVRADALRARYRSREDGGVSLDGITAEDPSTPEAIERTRRVRAALAALPEGQRLAVMLHQYDGLTFAEIADVLSDLEGRPVREGAVRVRAFRAHEVLRGALADLADEETP